MKTIFFDWSGVVKDSVQEFLWVVNEMLKEYDIKISLKELKDGWQQPYMSFYNKYVPDLTYEKQRELFIKAMFNKRCPKSYEIDGMTNFIKKLKEKGYYLAVVSSDLPETFFKEIKEYNLENIFNSINLDAHDKYIAVNKIINDIKPDLENTFFIGDSNHEIEVAKKTDIKSIGVTWGYSSEDNLKSRNPDFIVNNINELEKILL